MASSSFRVKACRIVRATGGRTTTFDLPGTPATPAAIVAGLF